MGDTIWVDVQGRAEDDLPADNSIMLRLDKQLDTLAAKLGVAKLTTFYDYSAMEEEFGQLGEFVGDGGGDDDAGGEDDAAADAGDGGASRGQWFDPSEALAAVRAIRQHLVRRPDDLGFAPDPSRSHWPAELVEELGHVQGVLEDAAARKKKFRFLIVP